MKKDLLCFALFFCLLTIVLTACGSKAPVPIPSVTAASTSTEVPATPTVSATPDPCVSPQLEEEVQKVQRHMREFDDASTLASNVPQTQLSNSISDLQRIRREADDEQIPACLTDLKTYQITHMNAVINTLLAFMRSSAPQAINCTNVQPNTESAGVCQNIALAREQHDKYLVELARLLGLTVVPATQATTGAPSETSTPTP